MTQMCVREKPNKVLNYHQFLQILLHSNKCWIKTSYGDYAAAVKKVPTKVMIVNGEIAHWKKRRRRLSEKLLNPQLTLSERISIQDRIEIMTQKIKNLKNEREEKRLPRIRGDKTQGVYRI